MGESIWCNIVVAVPTSWGDDPDEIVPVGLLGDALINGYTDATVEGAVTFWAVNGEGNYGLGDGDVENALSWCEEHGVPYYAAGDPKYEWLGEVRVFMGAGDVWSREGDGEGDVVMSRGTYNICMTSADPLAAVRAHFDTPDIHEASVAHLPATCPQDDEEDEGAMVL